MCIRDRNTLRAADAVLDQQAAAHPLADTVQNHDRKPGPVGQASAVLIGAVAVSYTHLDVYKRQLYAQYISYIDFSSFNQDISFNLTIYVFLGGAATMGGSIAGPVFMLLIPQLIYLLPIPASMTGHLQQLIYGLLLVTFMLFKPDGLVSKKSEGSEGLISRLLKRRGQSDGIA